MTGNKRSNSKSVHPTLEWDKRSPPRKPKPARNLDPAFAFSVISDPAKGELSYRSTGSSGEIDKTHKSLAPDTPPIFGYGFSHIDFERFDSKPRIRPEKTPLNHSPLDFEESAMRC
jgi:hypothetical protein